MNNFLKKLSCYSEMEMGLNESRNKQSPDTGFLDLISVVIRVLSESSS